MTMRLEGGDEDDEATSDPLATRLSRGHLRVPFIAMRMQSLWLGWPMVAPKVIHRFTTCKHALLTIVSHCRGTT